MSYTIRLTPVAQEDVRRLPPSAAVFLARQLELLAQNPTALSRPSRFPYPPDAQLYEFHRDIDGGNREFFHVLFKYGADEETIFIIGVARNVSNWWWGKDET